MCTDARSHENQHRRTQTILSNFHILKTNLQMTMTQIQSNKVQKPAMLAQRIRLIAAVVFKSECLIFLGYELKI
jgi:hypothetical protein